MGTVAAEPHALRRFTDTSRSAQLGVPTAPLELRLEALVATRSQGVPTLLAQAAHTRRWLQSVTTLDQRPAEVGEAMLAADRGSWAGVVDARQRRAVAPLATRLRAVLAQRRPDLARRFAERLTSEQRRHLAWAHPDLVGPADGLPVTMRYQANAVRVERAAAEQARTVVVLQRAGLPSAVIEPFVARWATLERLRGPSSDPATCTRTARQLLQFSAAGDGIAVEVFGDLATADHVAVFVPGITNTLDNFLDGTAGNAGRIHAAASTSAGSGRVATIAWLGYDTPGVLDAPLATRAHASGPLLRHFIEHLDLQAGATTTVIGHSYGSLVAGHALLDGLAVDHVVLAGSPGVGVPDVAALPGDAEVYALRAPRDPVAVSEWHGADPADPRFGATPLRTGDDAVGAPVTGHSAYFDSGTESLRNIGLVVADRGDQATRPVRDRFDDLLAWIDNAVDGFGPAEDIVERTDTARDLGRDAVLTVREWLDPADPAFSR